MAKAKAIPGVNVPPYTMPDGDKVWYRTQAEYELYTSGADFCDMEDDGEEVEAPSDPYLLLRKDDELDDNDLPF